MARILCPHCGAGNRDSQQTDTCWQCGKSLWEPVHRETYALGAIPPQSDTTALSPKALRLLRADTWPLWVAAVAAALSLLLFLTALVLYLSRPSGPGLSRSTAPNSGLNATL
jgi:hypothetical protein